MLLETTGSPLAPENIQRMVDQNKRLQRDQQSYLSEGMLLEIVNQHVIASCISQLLNLGSENCSEWIIIAFFVNFDNEN